MIKGHLKNLDKFFFQAGRYRFEIESEKVQIFAIISYLLGTLH